MMTMTMMMIIPITQSFFKLELPDFACQQIQVIHIDDDDDDDNRDHDDDDEYK